MVGVLLVSPASATQDPAGITININTSAGIMPTSTLYILDVLMERMSIWMTRDDGERVTHLMALADEKIQEVAGSAIDDPTAAGSASKRYEKYLKEAVKTAKKADNTDGKADELLAQISGNTLTHLDAFVSVGGAVAGAEGEYIGEVFETIGNQETEILDNIEDQEERDAVAVEMVEGIQEIEGRMTPLAKEYIGPTLQRLVGGIATFLLKQGEVLVDAYGEQVSDYLREKANTQLDKAKDSIIEEIKDLEF